ncbi:uncharacterized protein LAESUDRAFT_752181 [Laetiporus sulphureus 93-53]|uniref:Uncharacterized protein n=1 Tax=Laetiporus sulphureus 93-53 TaxID=1314785 RepID=A0A165CAQ2_9APHY|nr:uncharacterized protein LAESUDRAFT_752181 [Laetiporus sulphureus 93-53]KZT02472.1 hypothetical protein LAESUDRAFT_752181 [Laetiporus sulphureus 93-53]
MAEAGPSSPRTLSSTATTSPPSSLSRQLRIHFPLDEDRSSPGDDRSYGGNFPGLGTHAPRRKSTIGKEASILDGLGAREDTRRRVKSTEAKISTAGQFFSSGSGDLPARYSRRISHAPRKTVKRDRTSQGTFSDDLAEHSQSSAFSNEYDLSREDPRIIEDVQRAIRLKARREARMRASQFMSQRDPRYNSDVAPFSLQSSSLRPPLQISSVARSEPEKSTNDSEIDFSPSVGMMPLHPVPLSSNGGATLDWTGSGSEDDRSEKRWSLHRPKRKHKDRFSMPSGRNIVEKQDSLYADKLAQIRSNAKDRTLRKAAITSDQLQRRYNLLSPPPGSHMPSVNLLDVAHWYDKQELGVKASLEKAEPLTWLKHLLDSRGPRPSHPPWYLTALIMEEYAKSLTHHQSMATIPEDVVPPDSSPTAASLPETTKSPSSGSWSWNPSPVFLEPSLSRKRSSYDQQVSFEPHVESGRESVGAQSRPSNEGLNKKWRHSFTPGSDSAPDSLYSSRAIGGKNRSHLRNLAKRLRRRPYDSEEGLSSGRNSLSGRSFYDDAFGKLARSAARSQPASLRVRSSDTSGSDDEALSEPIHGRQSREETRTATRNAFERNEGGDGFPKPEDPTGPPDTSPAPPRRLIPRRRQRVSLPSSDRIVSKERIIQQEEIDEEAEHREYDRKAQLLEDAASHNYNIRHMLHRVGTSMREYDSVQVGLTSILGTDYPNLPPEVLEAFLHDPAAILGGTRTLSGWRAVEDIHERVQRQRKTLRSFVSALTPNSEDATPSKSMFHDPIASLQDSLLKLERHRQRVTEQAEKVMEMLMGVKHIHRTVKKEYNDTLAHTSLVYPELSQIVALEESYRNHYQQLWDFALDALTLLLDTVTPFWRNYGKVIGKDVQDFLIIPWYRNEFTGESKRYLIEKFPRRSLRHWVGLLCLYFLSLCVVGLQGRAAIELTLNWDLPWIPHTGLWWMVFPIFIVGLLIQWCAVLVESCIILAEWGVIVWWMGWTSVCRIPGGGLVNARHYERLSSCKGAHQTGTWMKRLGPGCWRTTGRNLCLVCNECVHGGLLLL